jgi:hypothetical protein
MERENMERERERERKWNKRKRGVDEPPMSGSSASIAMANTT